MSAASTSIVTCVESGPLEEMVLRLVESLRRWGGRLADAPVFAVMPRRGPPITTRTRREYDRLGVTFHRVTDSVPFNWHPFMTKAIALDRIERIATTDAIVWLDADCLVAGEPDELLLADDIDFIAHPEPGGIGTTGPGDRHEPFFAAICESLSVPIDDLPWLEVGGRRIRFYFNSGVFAYRRSTEFSRHCLAAHQMFFGSRIAHADAGVHYLQTLHGLTVIKRGLRWRSMGGTNHVTIHGWSEQQYPDELIRDARVLHYHNLMQPACWDRLCGLLEGSQPELLAWLRPLGPVVNATPLPYRLIRQGQRVLRAMRRERFLKRCRVVTEQG